MQGTSHEPSPHRKVQRSALTSDLPSNRAHRAGPELQGHTAGNGVLGQVELRPDRAAWRRLDGHSPGVHVGRTAGKLRSYRRDTFETIGACALIALILLTALTELPLIWLAEALR